MAVLQRDRLQWYGHVLCRDEHDWLQKCVDYDVEGVNPNGRPERTWNGVAEVGLRTLLIK